MTASKRGVNKGFLSDCGRRAKPSYATQVGIEWEWNAIDGAMVKAPLGGKSSGANPTDRGKSGTKRSLLIDGNGIPLAIVLDGANRHDMKLVERTLEAQQLVPTDLAQGKQRHLCADKGYGYEQVRQILQAMIHLAFAFITFRSAGVFG